MYFPFKGKKEQWKVDCEYDNRDENPLQKHCIVTTIPVNQHKRGCRGIEADILIIWDQHEMKT